MAQEKDRKKPKRTPRSKGTATEEKPYVEQFSELLMVHNKNDPKAGLGVVSQVDEKGTTGQSRLTEFVPEIRQEFEHPRKLHQEFLATVQGADPFPPAANDLQRLQAEQAGA